MPTLNRIGIAALWLALAPVLTYSQAPPTNVAPAFRLESVLGREVKNRDGESGRVIDLLMDADGRLHAAVIEFGGFLGIGSRKVAVEWPALSIIYGGGRTSIVVDIGREQLRTAPEYITSQPVVLLRTQAEW